MQHGGSEGSSLWDGELGMDGAEMRGWTDVNGAGPGGGQIILASTSALS